ncbi:MAG TPA: PD-(D/E)XK nuclease family protein [Acidobacteriota bacterium]|nr:PD-(D/E)XK nuclease family protein [Acidobacteriota bacterium]
MISEIVTAPSFGELKDELLEQLQAASREEALSPKWVLVPTSSLGNHLRLSLLKRMEEPVAAGIRILSMPQFALRLAMFFELETGSPWQPHFDLLLNLIVEGLPPESPLSRLNRIHGSAALLRPTFRDLADAGFGLGEEEILREASAPLPAMERDLLLMYLSWIRFLEALDEPWESLRLQRLPRLVENLPEPQLLEALGAEPEGPATVFVYGFYDFTDNNLELLTALSARVPCQIYLPGAEDSAHPAYSFADKTLKALQLRAPTSLRVRHRRTAPLFGSHVLKYFLASFPEGAVQSRPSFLTLEHASGVRAEALSAACRIREWLDAGFPPEEILLVAPRIEPYQEAVAEIFESFVIPVRRFAHPSGVTAPVRALQLVGKLIEQQLSLEWLLALFREFPEVCDKRGINLNRIEEKLRSLPFFGGSAWRGLLRFAKRSSNGEFDSRVTFDDAEIRFLEDFSAFWLDRLQADRSGHSLPLAEAIGILEDLEAEWLPEAVSLEPLVASLQRFLARQPDYRLKLSSFCAMLESAAEEGAVSDPIQLPGVQFGPMMQARGMTARGVVLLGLSAERLPFRLQEDPLLADVSREALIRSAGDVGHLLPVKSQISEEMALLFLLLNTSGEAVHWVIPETDETGRGVAATPWVQRYLQGWEAMGERPPGRMPRSPVDQAQHLLRLDPAGGRFLPPDLALAIDPSLAELFKVRSYFSRLATSLEASRRLPQWNGLVSEAALTRHSPKSRVWVTQLEDLCKCPFRFYAGTILRAQALEQQNAVGELSPMAWGGLLHDLLESCMRDAAETGQTLHELAEALLQDEAVGLGARIQQCAGWLSLLLPELLADSIRFRLKRIARLYFEQILEGENGDWVPVAVEEPFEAPFPGLEFIQITGKADRVDRAAASDPQRLRVVDYKSGRNFFSNGKKAKLIEISLGFLMQPILYPWSRRRQEDELIEFRFEFLGGPVPEIVPVDSPVDPEELLGSLAPILAKGHFFPTSNEGFALLAEGLQPCNWCSAISLCRRFDHAAGIRGMHLLKEQQPLRFQWMERVLNS